MKLFHNHDGADYQSQCVLAILNSQELNNRLEDNWQTPNVDRWQNGREQGYVIWWKLNGKQLNIAWFEHRNSDSICALEWKQLTMNAPTIDTIPESVYPDKWTLSHKVSVGHYDDMAEWIMGKLNDFHDTNRIIGGAQ